MDNCKPTRCIDPIIKFCQECQYGWVHFPDWVETKEDLSNCNIEMGCTLGFDKGRPEDEPTEEELNEFNKLSYKYVHVLDRAVVDCNCGERKW